MTDLIVPTPPRVTLVENTASGNAEREFYLGELTRPGETLDTDAQLIAAVERQLDRPAGSLAGYTVTRLDTGNLLVSKAFIYGAPMTVISSPLAHFGGEDMTVSTRTVPFPQDLADCQSYVGHPATRALLEALGAHTVSGRWAGPAVGEEYLAVPLAQNAREGGWTKDVAIESATALKAVLCKRIA